MNYFEVGYAALAEKSIDFVELKRDDCGDQLVVEVDILIKRKYSKLAKEALHAVGFVEQVSSVFSGYKYYCYVDAKTQKVWIIDIHVEFGRFGPLYNIFKPRKFEKYIFSCAVINKENIKIVPDKDLAVFYTFQLLFSKHKHEKRLQAILENEEYVRKKLNEFGLVGNEALAIRCATSKSTSLPNALMLNLVLEFTSSTSLTAAFRFLSSKFQRVRVFSFVGVDGTGKTSIINEITKNDVRIRSVYGGWKEFTQTTSRLMRLKKRFEKITVLRRILGILIYLSHFRSKLKVAIDKKGNSYAIIFDRDPVDNEIDPFKSHRARSLYRKLNWLLNFKCQRIFLLCSPLLTDARTNGVHGLHYHEKWRTALERYALKNREICVDISGGSVLENSALLHFTVVKELVCQKQLRK